jgi:acylglycerol lipase
MLQGGMSLDSEAGWNAWPRNLPLFLYHGGDDKICDPEATKRFGENVQADDKKVEIIPVSGTRMGSSTRPK